MDCFEPIFGSFLVQFCFQKHRSDTWGHKRMFSALSGRSVYFTFYERRFIVHGNNFIFNKKVFFLLKGIFSIQDYAIFNSLDLLTFSENSNYGRETLLNVIRQNIAGWCQQTFENKNKTKMSFTPQANFPAHNLNFHWRWRIWD